MFRSVPYEPPPYVPLCTIDDLACAIDVPPTSTDRQVLDFLDQRALQSDLDRLALGFPLVVRAWQIWRERGGQIDASGLRAQLVDEGLLAHRARG